MTAIHHPVAAPVAAPGAGAARCGGCCARPDNDWVARAIAGADARSAPFRHWLIDAVLPPGLLDLVTAPLDAAADTPIASVRRESIDPDRRFVGRDAVAADPAVAALAEAFDNCRTRRTISALCGADLAGSRLRIEHAVARDEVWLEPHTDIGARQLTLLVFLSEDPGSEGWGTDPYDCAQRPVARIDARRNAGLLFVPGTHARHGFDHLPIAGTRRTLVVNYVDEGWRARHELVRG